MTVVTGGLRERKKVQVREAIVAAALDLFERQGFEHTTVEEIAARCQISPRTFFRYFPNKESVLFGDSASNCADLTTSLLDQPADVAPMAAIRVAITPALAMLQNDRDGFERRARVLAATPRLRADRLTHTELWRTAIVDALATRRSATADARQVSRLELHLVAATALAAIEASLDTWLEEDGDLLGIVDLAFDSIAAGLR